MKRDSHDPALDALLQEWSQTTAAAPSDLDALRRKIVEAADAARLSSPHVPASSGEYPPLAATCSTAVTSALSSSAGSIATRPARDAGRYGWATASSLLVALLLVALVREVVRAPSSRPVGKDAANGELNWSRDAQLDAQRHLLADLEEMFDHRVEWFAETSEQLEFDVARDDEPRESATLPAAPLALRIVVQSRATANEPWNTTWSLDVVAKSERVVRLPVGDATGADVELWAFRLPDGMIHVEHRISLPNDLRLRFQNTVLLPQNRPIVVEQTATKDRTYRVIQWAAPLTPDVG